ASKASWRLMSGPASQRLAKASMREQREDGHCSPRVGSISFYDTVPSAAHASLLLARTDWNAPSIERHVAGRSQPEVQRRGVQVRIVEQVAGQRRDHQCLQRALEGTSAIARVEALLREMLYQRLRPFEAQAQPHNPLARGDLRHLLARDRPDRLRPER